MTKKTSRSTKPSTKRSKIPTVEYQARPEGYTVYVIFGSGSGLREIEYIDNMIDEKLFKTQEELDAYLSALSDMEGWSGYQVFDTPEEARAYLIEQLDPE
jgi:hypothetical protein